MLDDFSIKQRVISHHDFPKKGQTTRDLSGLLYDPRALQVITDTFAHRYLDAPISHLVTLKGLGSLFAAVLAYKLNLPLLVIGELGEEPGDPIFERAPGSTGERTLALRKNGVQEGDQVLLFDDILSSGASLMAAAALVRRQGATLHEVATLIDLPDQGGSSQLQEMDISTYSLMAFEDE